MREGSAPAVCTYPRCKCIVSSSTSQPEPQCPLGLPPQPPRITKAPPAPKPQESDLRKTKPNTKATRAAKAKTVRKVAAPQKAKAVDRKPSTVGSFIVAGGSGGRTMAQLEKQFAMDAHPLRSKIHAAKHKLGFTIDYDHGREVYTGSAPSPAKAAA